MRRGGAVILAALAVWPASSPAQTITAGVDLLFYGDNTEFANPFREGETLLGTSGRLFVDVDLNGSVRLRGGFFGNGRYGSHEFLEEAEPFIALQLRHGPSTFTFGSLDTMASRPAVRGPDEETPHDLLPPIQRETLTFSRAHEMGLQWKVASPRLQHDVWINWQRLNTENARERFDTGIRSRTVVSPALALQAQWHIVHEGGQQFASGAVKDSQAGAIGAEWARRTAARGLSLEGYAVATRETPDRERPQDTQNGIGIFTRAVAERGLWRAHLIVWRSRDTLKDEGDANYLMLRRDGTWFRKVRDYGEIGLTRHFRPAPGVTFDVSARMHRTESHYEYSYRLTGRVQLRHRLATP